MSIEIDCEKTSNSDIDLNLLSNRFDREETELTLDNVKHLVKLHDTAGQEDYERLRKIVYKDVSAWMQVN